MYHKFGQEFDEWTVVRNEMLSEFWTPKSESLVLDKNPVSAFRTTVRLPTVDCSSRDKIFFNSVGSIKSST